MESRTRENAQNLLVVSPAKPLPIGNGWRLIVTQGLPSTDSEVSLFSNHELEIGNVTAFAVTHIETENSLKAKKHIALSFSKRLPAEFNAENATRWITVSPSPANLKIEKTAYTDPAVIDIYGDFENNKSYRVSIAAGFPAADPFTLEKTWTSDVTFQPIPSRLYFQEITTHQLSTGSRQLPLLAVNVPEVSLRAKLLDAESIVFALQDFRDYLRENRRRHYDWTEPYQQLDYDKVVGRTIFSQQIAGSGQADEQQL